jgi:hypothetical protein
MASLLCGLHAVGGIIFVHSMLYKFALYNTPHGDTLQKFLLNTWLGGSLRNKLEKLLIIR